MKDWKLILSIAIPISIESVIRSLMSIFDQVMVGKLGSDSVVAVGLASKIFFVLLFTMIGLTTGLSILSAQLIGSKQNEKIPKIQGMTLMFGSIITLIFMLLSIFYPRFCMTLFTKDLEVIEKGIIYHKILALGYIPIYISMIYSTLLRNAKIVKFPMLVGLFGIILNTILNYFLIPKLNIFGAGLATVISQYLSCLVLIFVIYYKNMIGSNGLDKLLECFKFDEDIKLYWIITLPVLMENFSFVLTDSISNSIYGHMGVEQTIAVTLMFPIQGIIIGFFGGFSTASGVLVGNYLGNNELKKADEISRKILFLAIFGPLIIGTIFFIFKMSYLKLFGLNEYSLNMTKKVMGLMVIFLPVKIFNMTITNGALSAGGETKFILYQSMLGSWIFAVPLGYISSNILNLPIYLVFVAISLEEILRASLCLWKYRQKTWINNLVKQ